MKPRFALARCIGAVATWGLHDILRRPAANFPGKVGLYADPQLIAHLKPRIRESSIVVVGTNGKTTVTNLLADALEAAGKTVACNRTGANLDSGVATALLHAPTADWGVFESDELWLAKILPQLQPRFVVLLNLFRDQLDRVGEIDHAQASIAGALASSPATTLIYNTDDPLCQAIAEKAANPRIPFGIEGSMGLAQNTVADSGMCQRCSSMLDYTWRQYGQLGSYRCPTCGFSRTQPIYSARDVRLSAHGTSFEFVTESGSRRVSAPFPGAYMAYNLLALHTAAAYCGVPAEAVGRATQAFHPENGRLQEYEVDGHRILLNLAKNPTGFNQNLRIIMADPGPKAVAFFINDREADGHDVSWLWDVDFQELAQATDLIAFAGGLRGNDMQVRLKYAGVASQIVESAQDFLAQAQAALPHASFYLIANYTALPSVKAQLDHLHHLPPADGITQAKHGSIANLADATSAEGVVAPHAPLSALPADKEAGGIESLKPNAAPQGNAVRKLVIAHLYPDLLNLYGDGGNVTVLSERARARGIEVEVVRTTHGQEADLQAADIVFLGGGPDREQLLASHDLMRQANDLRAYVEDDGVLLAICGGFQIIGRTWVLGEEAMPGLSLVDAETRRAPGGSHNRLVGNIVLESPLASMPVVGYENHAGRTFLDPSLSPLGHVIGHHGKGNNADDGADGVLYRNVVGTYLHGPLLSKNPQLADALLARALARRAEKEGRLAPELPPLDDSAEIAANEHARTL